MKKYLKKIEQLRTERIFPVSINGELALPKELSTKVSGLYWLYTTYDIASIKNCRASTQENAVNIPLVATLHEGLTNIYKANDEKLLVYNGIGKELRKRIQQEFNGGEGTASLGISKTSLNRLDNWFFSYVIMSDGNSEESSDIDVSYSEHGKNLERMWRLEYGWPLLCRH